jgi:hypothetical protein
MRNYLGSSTMRSIFLSMPWKSPINVSKGVWVHSTNGFHGFYQIIDPPSFKSSLSTLVTTACLMFIILIERATFLVRPSQQFWSFFTPQNPQELYTFPNILCGSLPQHSPMFGQLPEVQMVSSCICLQPRSSVYFWPIGSFTFNHFGLATFSLPCQSSLR